MDASISAPFLRQIKSWQLVCLGISGWVTLYSAAILHWGACSFVVGNTQGGSFAAVMALASREARRLQRGSLSLVQWAGGISHEQLNQALATKLQADELLIESLHPTEAGMGFGLRAVKAGRTFLFETARWKESVIDLLHARTTDRNRELANADFAVIVGVGTPDEETRIFANSHPMKLLVGEELKAIFDHENPAEKGAQNGPASSSGRDQSGPAGRIDTEPNMINSGVKGPAKSEQPAVKAAKPAAKSPGQPSRTLRIRWK